MSFHAGNKDGYSIKLSDDDCTATITLRAQEAITERWLITMLLDIAIQKLNTEDFEQ